MSEAPPFFTRYGFSDLDPTGHRLAISPYPWICRAGALRATIVASAIDILGGVCTREIAGADATFTSDLSLRIPSPGTPERIEAVGSRLREGRRLVTTGVMLESGGHAWGYGETTFSRIARAPKDAPPLEKLATPTPLPSHPLEQDLAEEVGVELLDATQGQVRIVLRPSLLNPEGVMQGALVALAVECGALACAEEALGRAQAVSELDLRYLAAASRGPVESETRWIGRPGDRMLRVVLRDVGRDDRVTTTALVRLVDARA
ncbi:MAG: PaaI family thioesterase [Myxococcota bacterium]